MARSALHGAVRTGFIGRPQVHQRSMAFLGRAMSGSVLVRCTSRLEDRGRHVDCGPTIALRSFGAIARPI
jgi:hypothetical protein